MGSVLASDMFKKTIDGIGSPVLPVATHTAAQLARGPGDRAVDTEGDGVADAVEVILELITAAVQSLDAAISRSF